MRYPTAGALRDDLRRFRSDEPVQALVAAAERAGPQRRSGRGRARGRRGRRRHHAQPDGGAHHHRADDATAGGRRAVDRDDRGRLPDRCVRRCDVLRHQLVEDGLVRDRRVPRPHRARDRRGAAVPGAERRRTPTTSRPSSSSPTTRTRRSCSPTSPPISTRSASATRPSPRRTPLVPVGFVHRTNPVAGTLILAEQTVQVYFNPDPQLVPVPGVVGLTLEDARLRLEGDGFKVGEITIEKTDEVAENTVISTDPAGRHAGAAGFDRQHRRGRSARQRAGARPGRRHDRDRCPRRCSRREPYQFVGHHRGAVEFDDPGGNGHRDQPGTGRAAWRRDRPSPSSCRPDRSRSPCRRSIGQTEGRARNTLTEDGLVVRVTFQEVHAGSPDDGRVIAQSLPADSLAAPGTEITITVGRSVQVPTTLPPDDRPSDDRAAAHHRAAHHRGTDHRCHPPRIPPTTTVSTGPPSPGRRVRSRVRSSRAAWSGGAGEEVAQM